MSNKKRIILISIIAVLIIVLVALVFLLNNLNKKKEVDTSSNDIYENISNEQISSFQDVKLIEELLASGKQLDEDIGQDLEDDQVTILEELGVSDALISTYRVYSAKGLLDSGFISSDGEEDQKIDEWKNNYINEKYIISQNQELAFLVNGRKDEKGRLQYARIVEDEEVYEELYEQTSDDKQVSENKGTINIRKVERLKYSVSIDYPDNAIEPKYAIKSAEEDDMLIDLYSMEDLSLSSEEIYIEDLGSDSSEDSMDYDSLQWIDYEDTFYIEENATIYTKYKLNEEDTDYTIGNSKEVPELILSTPTYEIVEDGSTMYVKFSNSESEYNKEVRFKISYGKKETEEEPTYCDWYEVEENKFKIEEVGKYYIKFIATIPDRNVTDSKEEKISIGRLDNTENVGSESNQFQIVDTTKEDIIKSSNTSLKSIKVNGVSLSQSIINSLNNNGTATYSLSSANSVILRAYAQDQNSVVIGNGIYNFKNNQSVIKIQIVADDGSKGIFTLTVTRNSTQSSSSTSNTNSAVNNFDSDNQGSTSSDSNVFFENDLNNGNSGSITEGTSQGDNNNSGNASSGNSNGQNNNAETVCNHSWQAATCTSPATCTKCGLTQGGASAHSWQAATCTSPETCAKCGLTQGSTSAHSWRAATCSSPKTCTKCGLTEGSTLAHSWQAATCTSLKKCVKCGLTEGALSPHKWKAATCSRAKTCTVCGTTEGEPLEHNWVTVNGVKKCSLCGKKST